jgi:uncharacterized protein YpmB
MKNSAKVLLSIVFIAVSLGTALTFCTSKSDKPVDSQDTVKIDTVQNQVDTTTQENSIDSATVK